MNLPIEIRGVEEGRCSQPLQVHCMSRKEININCPSPARRFYLTELIYCFAALVTLLVNDAKSDQRNTTVAVLGKGSSFGVCKNFFSLFVLFSVIHEAHAKECG